MSRVTYGLSLTLRKRICPTGRGAGGTGLIQHKSLETIDAVAESVALFDSRLMRARSARIWPSPVPSTARPRGHALHAMLARAYARADPIC